MDEMHSGAPVEPYASFSLWRTDTEARIVAWASLPRSLDELALRAAEIACQRCLPAEGSVFGQDGEPLPFIVQPLCSNTISFIATGHSTRSSSWLKAVATAVLDGICVSLGLPNLHFGKLLNASEVLSSLTQRVFTVSSSAAVDLNVRSDGVPLTDLLPSLPKQVAIASSQPSLLMNDSSLLPCVASAAAEASAAAGSRTLGSGLWQGSSCLRASLHPFLHNIARLALSYAHTAPCASLLGACSGQRMSRSTGVQGGLQVNTFVGVFFLPCVTADGSSMQSWQGYVSSRRAPAGSGSTAPLCTALAAFVSAVPEMALVTLVALPHAAQAIPEVLRTQVLAAQVEALHSGTEGGLFSVHDTPCVAPLPPLALPPSLHASMAARSAAASAKETKEGAALRHAGAGERSGVIAGPAFSQLEHIDESITGTITSGPGNALLYFCVLEMSSAMLTLPPSRQPKLRVAGRQQALSRLDSHSRWWWAVQAALREVAPALLQQVALSTDSDAHASHLNKERAGRQVLPPPQPQSRGAGKASDLAAGLLLSHADGPEADSSPDGPPHSSSSSTDTPSLCLARSAQPQPVRRLVYDEAPAFALPSKAEAKEGVPAAVEASIGFSVPLVEGVFPFRVTARRGGGGGAADSVVLTVVDDSTPQDMRAVVRALLAV